jgi:23S rRNA pseudouridine1911/1915/1917 synthase
MDVAAELEILLEDNHCLAVAKPAPLLTQAPPGVPSLEALVKEYLRQRYHKKGNVYLGIPHRLDRPVSGVVLFARNTKAARRLAAQFQERKVGKLYWGAVEGAVQPAAGHWEDWLRKLPDQARSESAAPHAEGARRALLHYRVLGGCAGGTLLEFAPETGRMHQIRVQAAQRGWPLRGDALYGAKLALGPPLEHARDRVIALHARSLTFLHPLRFEPVTVTAALPAWWQELGLSEGGQQGTTSC